MVEERSEFEDDKTKGARLKRLREAVEYSRRKMEPFRRNRLSAIREFVGKHYSEDGSTDKVPVNLLELAVSIYTRTLAARNPKALITTPHKSLHPYAFNLELAVNYFIEHADLIDVLRQAIVSALFSIGIVKVGIEPTGTIDIDGEETSVGQPYIENVSLDDFVWDMTARNPKKVQFVGHKFRIPVEDAIAAGLVTEEEAESAKDVKRSTNESGDERADTIGGGSETAPVEYVEHIELWEIFLPREQRVITYHDSINRILRVATWDGPATGPFFMLSFSDVPENIMPLSPIANLRDLHALANRLFTKMGRQADRQKTLLGVSTNGLDDGGRVRDASDGETVPMQDPNNAREYRFGGFDPQTLAFFLQARDIFSWLGGNLDALGGLGPQSDTVGQDQMLTESASRRISDMSERVIEFVGHIIHSIAWFLFTDPLVNIPISKRVPNTDHVIQTYFNAETRRGDFLDYNFKIDPYSMKHDTPEAKLRTFTAIFKEFIAPFAEAMAAQGIMVNFESVLRTIARYANMPDVEDMVIVTNPQEQKPGPVLTSGGARAGKSSSTSREYIRRNVPGRSRRGADQIMSQLLMGGNPQQAERESLVGGRR